MNTTHDELVPPCGALELFEALPHSGKRLMLWEGDHDYVPPEMLRQAIEFLRYQIDNPAPHRRRPRSPGQKVADTWPEVPYGASCRRPPPIAGSGRAERTAPAPKAGFPRAGASAGWASRSVPWALWLGRSYARMTSMAGMAEVAEVTGDENATRWGVWPPLRVAGMLLSVAFVGFGLAFAVVAAAADGADIVGRLLLAPVFAAFGVGMFRVGVWPALIATRDGLVIPGTPFAGTWCRGKTSNAWNPATTASWSSADTLDQ